MAQIESWFSQDLAKAVKVQYLDGNVFSADNEGNKIGVVVTNNGEPVTLTGSISGVAVRCDGGSVALTGGFSNNKAWVTLPSAAYAVPGLLSIIIKNTNSTQITTLCAVVAYVYIANSDQVIDPGEVIPSVEELIAAIDAAIASIPADYSSLWTSLAPAFSSSTSYAPGQYVTYNGGLYRFDNAHSGSWASGDVSAITLGGELRSIRNTIAPEFDETAAYTAGDFVYHSGGLYKIMEDHAAGVTWANTSKASATVDAAKKHLYDQIAPQFSADATYKTGQYVVRNNNLYRFVSDHSGAWDGAHVVSAVVGKGLTNAEINVNDVGARVDVFVPKTVIPAENKYVNFPISYNPSLYIGKFTMIEGGLGGYYGYGLYKNGSLVWGVGNEEANLIWRPAGSTLELIVPSGIEADTLQVRNRNSREGTTVSLCSVGNENISDLIAYQSPYHYLRRIGIEPVAVTCTASGDATYNSSTKTLTIPSGKTGYNSYFTLAFYWANIDSYDYSSQEAVLTIALNCSKNPAELKLSMWNVTAGLENTTAKLIGKIGTNTYIYELRFAFPAALTRTSNEFNYIQVKNETAVSSSTTIQYVGACLEWEGRDRAVAGDYDLIRFKSVLHFLRRIGMKPVTVGVTANGDATADTTTKTITIPTGKTGNNSYYTLSFSWSEIKKYAYSSQPAVMLLAIRCNRNPDTLKPLIWYDTMGVDSTETKLIGKIDADVYLYELRFNFPAALSGQHNEVVYIQFKNEITYPNDVTIRYIDSSLEWEGYDRSVIGSMINSAKQNPVETVLEVGTGKTYTSLRTALEYAATIANSTNHVTVQYYGEGVVYDLMDDITETDLTTESSFIGLVVPANCKLLGMGSREQNKVELTLPEGTDADVAFRISTVNLIENAELENMWFYGKRCRYACHDDTQTYNPEWKLKTVRNCKFTSDYTNQHRSYGAGYRSGVNWLFENCIFENINGEETEFGNAAFSAHNNNGMEKAANITFINCYASGGHGFGFESLNRTTGQTYPNAKTMISFYGCKAITHVWDRPIQTSIPAADAVLEVCVTGSGNNFGNNDVAVYCGGEYYNDRFADQLTLVNKVNIVDGLTSTSTDSALSAKQGKVLNEQIAGLIKIENKTISNLSIPAGESGSTLNVAKTGYTFKGVIGYALYGVSECIFSRLIQESTGVLTYNIYNTSGSAKTATSVIFTCLYIKS